MPKKTSPGPTTQTTRSTGSGWPCHAAGSAYHRCNGPAVPYHWTIDNGTVLDLNLCGAGLLTMKKNYKDEDEKLDLKRRDA